DSQACPVADGYSTSRALMVDGAQITIGSGADIGETGITLVNYTEDQRIDSDVALNWLYLEALGDTTKTLNLAEVSGGNVERINFIQRGTGKTLTLKLDSDVTLRSGGYVTTDSTGAPTNGTVTFAIDTNGHTLDLTNGQGLFRNSKSTTTTNWIFKGNGTIKENDFDLSLASTTSVEGTTTLIAVGGDGSRNELAGDNSDGISADSTFIYAGNASAANAAILSSNRSIGHLIVRSGALRLEEAIDATSITVNTNAQLIADSFTYADTFSIEFDEAATEGDFQILDFNSQSGTVTTVTLTGFYDNVALSDNGSGVWTTELEGMLYSFTKSNGLLHVEAAIPEASSVGLYLALMALISRMALKRRSNRG
ncbi:MAG: hypothetical protein ACQKBW_07915, partial [Puniceicoccales bacterium]